MWIKRPKGVYIHLNNKSVLDGFIILLINYMKSGLLLTLKELIKLGVIKIKKRRRRRGLSTTNTSIGQDQRGLGLSKYNAFVTTSAPNPQAYSDALRLRDENRNFDTRLLEYKNQQQEQKLLLEDQQQLQQRLQQIQDQQQLVITQGIPAVQNLIARTAALESGFVEDDNIDVTEVNGSDDFKTQQDIADPELRQLQPPPPKQQTREELSTPSPRPTLKEMTKTTVFESEYEDEPDQEMQTIEPIPKRRYNTKRIKGLIDEKMKINPKLTKEEARVLVLKETESITKQKKK